MQEKPPTRLRAGGRRLWREVVDQWELRADELAELEQACRTVDLIAVMETELRGRDLIVRGSTGQDALNPLIPELRAQRATLAALLSKMQLPDETTGVVNQHRDAAQTKWARAHGAAA